ncbi:TonB-dependent receptor [bacterium]|nr:TonB-dependent receptor [candidate division CSSED10-310 bacterium]
MAARSLKLSVTVFFLLVALVFAHTLHADENNTSFEFDTNKNGYVYSIAIEVKERQSETVSLLQEIPAFVTVVELDNESSKFQTVSEVLSGTVGVTIKDFGGLGKLSTVSIRGSAASHVIVLLDGIKINTSADNGVDLSTLPIHNISKIEILRGADSAVFGDGAIAGVINLVSKKQDDKTHDSGGRITYGSFSTLDTFLYHYSDLRFAKFRLQGFLTTSDGDFRFNNNNGTEMNQHDDFEDVRSNNWTEKYGGSLWWEIADLANWKLSGQVNSFRSDNGIPGIVTFPSEHATQTDKRTVFSIHAEKNLSLPPNSLFFTNVSISRSSLDFRDPFGEQTGVPVYTLQNITAIEGDVGLTSIYSWGSSSISSSYSTDHLNDEDIGKKDSSTWSISGKQDLSLLNDKFWLTLLARYDRLSETGEHFSPKAGMRYQISPNMALKMNTGQSFRSPSFDELYTNTGFITGNEALLPEEGFSWDTGMIWEHRKFRGEIAYFEQHTKNLIQYVLVSGFRYKPLNIGKSKSRGIEASIGWNFWKNFNVSSSYTYIDAQDLSEDRSDKENQIPGIPKHEWFSKLEWRQKKFNSFMEWRFTSGNYVTRSNTKELPSRETGNIGIGYEFTEHMRFSFEIKNLFDNEMMDIRGFPLPPRSYFFNVSFTI